jgi:lysophospholipase L1-like esterase
LRRWFRIVALLLPVLLIGSIEGMFRLKGFGGYPLLLRRVGPVEGGELVLADQSGAIPWFFANSDRPGYNDQYTFVTPKPTNVFRVFMVGESAMKGYPQPRNLASSAFLQVMLQDAWPERRVEVINLGTTAVASYPVLGMMTEALEYQPDLVIIHTGHNEFFGTYGVASVGRAGGQWWTLPLTRFFHSLATVQAWQKHRQSKGAQLDRTLMETMVGNDFVPLNSGLRKAAARNLQINLTKMIRRCQERAVPVMVCTLPTNERDLAPVGRPETALSNGLLTAQEHFQRGRSLFAEGQTDSALKEFIAARDADTMPWRAPSAAQQAVRAAAQETGAMVCDLENSFRTNSPGGCIGWELMDDHVHPTLRGQALMAEEFASTMTWMDSPAKLAPDAQRRIAGWETYAQRLGDNPYDRYGVAHSMRVLFEVPFMKSSNPEGYARFSALCADFEQRQDTEVLQAMKEWHTFRPHVGAKRPLSGMVARVFLRQGKLAEAEQYYQIARLAVPAFTSWHMEYTYFMLVTREKRNGQLNEADRQMAAAEIEQGKFLLRRGVSESGFAERHLGRLHQLRGEFAEAIPYLLASRAKLAGFDLVAADQALVVSYLRLQEFDRAKQVAANGAKNAGEFAGLYQKMLEKIPVFERNARTNNTSADQP